MSQIFGEFIQEFPLEHDFLELSFTSSSRPNERRWRNNRLSAYFVADYFSNIVLIDEERIKEMKNIVSYVSNELLENAMKFNEEIKPAQVNFGIHFLEDIEKVIVVITKNSIMTEKVDKFQALIKEILWADKDELYIQQIEKTSEDEHSEASGLGLLTIVNDYSAKLGWFFESDPSNSQITTVTTMAQVVV